MKVNSEDVIYASENTVSAAAAARMLGIKFDTYKKYALELGCYKTNQSGKGVAKGHKFGHCFNDGYFDVVDSLDKAYFLGYIAADGCVYNNVLSFRINRKDRMILELFCNAVEYDVSHIVDYQAHYKDENGVVKYFDASSLQLASLHMCESLKLYNVVQNKSNLDNDLFCSVPLQFRTAWLIGYIDGDGCIRRNSYSVSLISNYSTICSVSDYLCSCFDVCNGRFSKIGDITYELTYSKKENVLKLLILYVFGSNYHLLRKYENACGLLSEYSVKGTIEHRPKIRHVALSREIVDKKQNFCVDCGAVISLSATRCKSCSGSYRENGNSKKPERDILKDLLKSVGNFLEIGRIYGVSDNAVRKWCKSYELPFRSSDIKALSEDEWDCL